MYSIISTPLTTREFLLCCLVLVLIFLSHIRLRKLEIAYINDNFGCYTRIGGIAKASKIIQRDRRRVASGKLVLIACDVAGMGLLNTKIGETAVNDAVKSAFTTVRSWRGVQLISQINSGDEFALIVDSVDADGICEKLDTLFKSYGFKGVYTAVNSLSEGYLQATVKGMQSVYSAKQSLLQYTV